MITDKISGYFDCRKYDKKLERAARQLKADTENVTFTTTFAAEEVPEAFKNDDFVKAYTTKDGAARVAITFKIGMNCRWFDKFGKPCARPANADLDAARYEVQIEYTRKAKTPGDDKAPSGFWANSIMYRAADANPFSQPFEDDGEQAQAQPIILGYQSEAVDKLKEATIAEQSTPDLPF